MKLSLSIILPLLANQACAFSQNRYLSALNSAVVSAETASDESAAVPVSTPVAASEEQEPVLMDVTKDFQEDAIDPKILDPKYRVQPGRYNDREMSISVPFLKRPSKLDGTHAGDVGFDPLGLSETNDLYVMMEAEIRHARLAMLAVVGWPLSELNAPSWMLHGKTHLAPSVLNGFDPLNFIGFAAVFGALGYFEFQTAFRRVDNTPMGKIHTEDMANVWKYGVPGDYNFDPLNLYSCLGDTADGRKALREAEIAHGRAAMLGITYFALWEAVSGHPIVENSMFFHPNAVLPLLGFAYLAFGQFYEIEADDQYLFQVRQTSEGKVNASRLKNLIAATSGEAQENGAKAAEVAGDVANILGYTGKEMGVAYEKALNAYEKFSMRNYE